MWYDFFPHFRYQYPDRLSRVVNKLHQWELDFHDHEHTEVLKCWRLHLGSCDVLKDVIAAQNYDSNSTLNSITNKIYLPIKNKWRDLRRIPKDKFGQDIQNQENCCKKFLKGCAWLYNTLFFAFRPFLGASALYFDIFKNISFVYLFWTALEVLTDGKEDEEIAKAQLEYAMIVFMLTGKLIKIYYNFECKSIKIYYSFRCKLIKIYYSFWCKLIKIYFNFWCKLIKIYLSVRYRLVKIYYKYRCKLIKIYFYG